MFGRANKQTGKQTTTLLAALALALAFVLTGCIGGKSALAGTEGPITGNPEDMELLNFTDSRDGKKYRTVKMPDGKVWMAENLNYYLEGSRCYGEGVSGVSADSIAKNCNTYGRLYNWETAKKVCPKGWHLPSDKEWTRLTDNIGSPAGTKLKATSGWNETKEGGNGSDVFGFSALPGGQSHHHDGRFDGAGYVAFWWSSTSSFKSAYTRSIYNSHVNNDLLGKPEYYSVRCVKN